MSNPPQVVVWSFGDGFFQTPYSKQDTLAVEKLYQQYLTDKAAQPDQDMDHHKYQHKMSATKAYYTFDFDNFEQIRSDTDTRRRITRLTKDSLTKQQDEQQQPSSSSSSSPSRPTSPTATSANDTQPTTTPTDQAPQDATTLSPADTTTTATTTTATPKSHWYYYEVDTWTRYISNNEKTVETAYQQYLTDPTAEKYWSCELDIHGTSYTINFSTHKQTNNSTKNTRFLRRVPPALNEPDMLVYQQPVGHVGQNQEKYLKHLFQSFGNISLAFGGHHNHESSGDDENDHSDGDGDESDGLGFVETATDNGSFFLYNRLAMDSEDEYDHNPFFFFHHGEYDSDEDYDDEDDDYHDDEDEDEYHSAEEHVEQENVEKVGTTDVVDQQQDATAATTQPILKKNDDDDKEEQQVEENDTTTTDDKKSDTPTNNNSENDSISIPSDDNNKQEEQVGGENKQQEEQQEEEQEQQQEQEHENGGGDKDDQKEKKEEEEEEMTEDHLHQMLHKVFSELFKDVTFRHPAHHHRNRPDDDEPRLSLPERYDARIDDYIYNSLKKLSKNLKHVLLFQPPHTRMLKLQSTIPVSGFYDAEVHMKRKKQRQEEKKRQQEAKEQREKEKQQKEKEKEKEKAAATTDSTPETTSSTTEATTDITTTKPEGEAAEDAEEKEKEDKESPTEQQQQEAKTEVESIKTPQQPQIEETTSVEPYIVVQNKQHYDLIFAQQKFAQQQEEQKEQQKQKQQQQQQANTTSTPENDTTAQDTTPQTPVKQQPSPQETNTSPNTVAEENTSSPSPTTPTTPTKSPLKSPTKAIKNVIEMNHECPVCLVEFLEPDYLEDNDDHHHATFVENPIIQLKHCHHLCHKACFHKLASTYSKNHIHASSCPYCNKATPGLRPGTQPDGVLELVHYGDAEMATSGTLSMTINIRNGRCETARHGNTERFEGLDHCFFFSTQPVVLQHVLPLYIKAFMLRRLYNIQSNAFYNQLSTAFFCDDVNESIAPTLIGDFKKHGVVLTPREQQLFIDMDYEDEEE